MAKRPIYIPQVEGDCFVNTEYVDFEWFPGFSITQKQKSIKSFHKEAKKILGDINILEISSKSEIEIGKKLSAFNLLITTTKYKKTFSVESAFQASKVFQNGGPFIDLLEKTSREAKKDGRLKKSGRLLKFKFYNTEWELEPKTLFYDWLYIKALLNTLELKKKILEYDAFTDIEFNPEKSINCQAYSAALFVSLSKRNILDKTLSSVETYTEAIKSSLINNAYEDASSQKKLF
ncbi:MAG: hypothetical protein AB2777_20470 [Candidatus Thiodiazotropha endolucinida]